MVIMDLSALGYDNTITMQPYAGLLGITTLMQAPNFTTSCKLRVRSYVLSQPFTHFCREAEETTVTERFALVP